MDGPHVDRLQAPKEVASFLVTVRSSDSTTPWVWPLALVAAMHLLSTSGTWWITDHGEILATADRFLATGRLNLVSLGPGWEDWTRIVEARGSTETRFLPLSVMALIPFLALDLLFGFRDPTSFRFAHLQGHVFVLAGIALCGRRLAQEGKSNALTALSILVLGLNWPVWMIARRIGPEPILFALLAAFVAGGTRARLAVLILLSWTHATGPLLGAGGLLWWWLQKRGSGDRSMPKAAIAWALGIATVGLFWNFPVHGHMFLGGYDRYASGRGFDLHNPFLGMARLLTPMLAMTLPLWWLTFRPPSQTTRQVLALWLPLTAFLGLLSHPVLLGNPEPERRLAPLMAASVITCMSGAKAPGRLEALLLAVVAGLSGVFGLASDFVATVPTPLGLYSGPHLLFLRMAFQEGHPVGAGVAVFLLISAAVLAGSRSLRLILGPQPDI